jgi:hypothetical protein
VKDENGDLLAESHNILDRWKNYFSQLFIVRRFSDVRQIEMHTADPLIPDPNHFEDEIAILLLLLLLPLLLLILWLYSPLWVNLCLPWVSEQVVFSGERLLAFTQPP